MAIPVKKEMHALRIGPQGRVVLPARLRKQIGLAEGDMLVVWPEGDLLVLRRRTQIEEELWAMFRKVKGSPARELIAERRKDARRESRT
jgi:AbrB family looped-hinge helix DNA binding protein